jgi:hypothetical protein
MIRYGGLYARHRDIDQKLNRAISTEQHKFYRSFNELRTAILSSFGYEPLKCPNCNHNMSDDELLDMDYFLNVDDLDDDFGKEGFYIF